MTNVNSRTLAPVVLALALAVAPAPVTAAQGGRGAAPPPPRGEHRTQDVRATSVK
jgi:hypothetical protein